MINTLEQFREDIERARTLGTMHDVLSQQAISGLDLTDLLRSQIVMVVSALDHYIHEITRIGMLEVYDGKRPQTPAFLRFQVKMEATLQGIAAEHGDNRWLDEEIRRNHGHLPFQQPNKIADAIRLFSTCKLWPSVASELNLKVEDVKAQLQLILDRRNQIVHESDLDPSNLGNRWAISPLDSAKAINFIQKLGETIHIVVN